MATKKRPAKKKAPRDPRSVFDVAQEAALANPNNRAVLKGLAHTPVARGMAAMSAPEIAGRHVAPRTAVFVDPDDEHLPEQGKHERGSD